MISRRDMSLATATGAVATAGSAQAATFGNPDEPPQGAINATNPATLTDPGPRNPAIFQPVSFRPVSACNGRRRHADVLGLFQQLSEAYPERRLGASGDAS